MWPWASNCAHVSLSLKEGHLYVLFIPVVGPTAHLPQFDSGSCRASFCTPGGWPWLLASSGLPGWLASSWIRPMGRAYRKSNDDGGWVGGVGIFFLLSLAAPPPPGQFLKVATPPQLQLSLDSDNTASSSPSQSWGHNGIPWLFSPGICHLWRP